MARIAGINIPQNKVVSVALTYIHGIGLHSSKNLKDILSKLFLDIKKNKNGKKTILFSPAAASFDQFKNFYRLIIAN